MGALGGIGDLITWFIGAIIVVIIVIVVIVFLVTGSLAFGVSKHIDSKKELANSTAQKEPLDPTKQPPNVTKKEKKGMNGCLFGIIMGILATIAFILIVVISLAS